MFNFINFILGINKFDHMCESFEKLDKASRFYYYLRLRKKYKAEFGIDKSEVLAVQVVNYLMGIDFDEVYSSVENSVKKRIDEIVDIILEKADEEMKDREVREFVSRTLIVKTSIYSSKYENYTKSIEFSNWGNIINKYFSKDKPEFEHIHDFKLYAKFIKNFINKQKN